MLLVGVLKKYLRISPFLKNKHRKKKINFVSVKTSKLNGKNKYIRK